MHCLASEHRALLHREPCGLQIGKAHRIDVGEGAEEERFAAAAHVDRVGLLRRECSLHGTRHPADEPLCAIDDRAQRSGLRAEERGAIGIGLTAIQRRPDVDERKNLDAAFLGGIGRVICGARRQVVRELEATMDARAQWNSVGATVHVTYPDLRRSVEPHVREHIVLVELWILAPLRDERSRAVPGIEIGLQRDDDDGRFAHGASLKNHRGMLRRRRDGCGRRGLHDGSDDIGRHRERRRSRRWCHGIAVHVQRHVQDQPCRDMRLRFAKWRGDVWGLLLYPVDDEVELPSGLGVRLAAREIPQYVGPLGRESLGEPMGPGRRDQCIDRRQQVGRGCHHLRGRAGGARCKRQCGERMGVATCRENYPCRDGRKLQRFA